MLVRASLAIASFIFLATSAALGPAPQEPQLKLTLEKLDAASKRFTSAEAHVKKTFHDHLIPGDDEQDGQIFFKREATSTEMGYRITSADPSIVTFKNGSVKVYRFNTKHCDAVTRPGLDTYLTLGFGGSGSDLAKVWNITDLGSETFEGTKVEKLDLVPKDPSVKANVAKFTIWVDLTRGVSLKQVLLAPTNDTQTAVYSITKYNEPIDTKPFTIPGGCK